ncbi:MAG: zinc ABC transporter substrate-binding protein [Paracoccaceae bacterium]
MRCLSLMFTALLLFGGAALAGVPRVVTDIPAVHSLTAQVMGDLGEPALLVTGATDPHHMQLRPSQARALARADMVIWVGPDLTPWLAHSLNSLAPDARVLTLLDLPESKLLGISQRPAIADSAVDPHAWLDPENAALWLAAIADALSRHDPANRQIYQANANSARQNIAELLSVIRADLVPATKAQLIVAHDAYGYFARRFALNIAGVLSDGDAAKPGAAHLREIQTLLESGTIACAFNEPNSNPALLKTLVKGTGVPTAVLNPAGIGIEPGPELYGKMMRNLASDIAACIGGYVGN